MDSSFRASDRGSPPPHRSDGYLGLPGMQGPLRRPIEWEALPLQIFRKVRAVGQFIGEEAARREQFSPEEVSPLLEQIMRKMRNLEQDLIDLACIENERREFEVRQSLAFARGHHGRFGPDPFFGHDHFVPPMPMPMSSPPLHTLPTMQTERFGAWQGLDQFGPRLHAGFGERMPFRGEERRQSPLLHRTQMPAMDEAFQRTEASSKRKVGGMKRKAAAIAATTVPKKVQKPARDSRCHVIEVSLNEHLGRSTHQAKLSHCGASKEINGEKNYSQTTTVNKNKNGTGLRDAPMKVCMPTDGSIHEVVQKNNLRCDDCQVSCDSDETMVVHLQSKEHYIMVWSVIETMRMNTKPNGGLASPASPCESKPESVEAPEEQTVKRNDEVKLGGSVL